MLVRTYDPLSLTRRRRMAGSRLTGLALFVLLGLCLHAVAWAQQDAGESSGTRVLTVGEFRGNQGDFDDIQAAVDAAEPGDLVLIAPGDYHPSGNGGRAGVYITTPNITLRGMARNSTIIDGTRPDVETACSAAADRQTFGPAGDNGDPQGRNGVWVFEADGVNVENLTVCNFLTGTENKSGNQVFFDGDEDTPIGLGAWRGAYLTTTSTFFSDENRGEYGLFASSSSGPGIFIHTYASNFADSGYYIGACPDCNSVIDDAHAQNNSLGYSGTNSGGRLIIQNSEWDHNKTGIVTNSQSVGDPPPPQDGACPADVLQDDFVDVPGNIQTTSCWVARNNFIHDNNNPDVPSAGISATGPVGTGLVVAGGRNDIIENNRIENNGAWGILLALFPDDPAPAGGTPPPTGEDQRQPDCRAGTNVPDVNCIFNVSGVEVANNTFSGNGGFGNPGNGDLAELSLTDPSASANCWHDNTVAGDGQITSDPPMLQSIHGACNVALSSNLTLGQLANPGPDIPNLLIQVACNTMTLFPCPDGVPADYPRSSQVSLMARPESEATMPNPCAAVPDNAFCEAGSPISASDGDTGLAISTNGGGCTIASAPQRDPLFPALIVLAGVVLLRRRCKADIPGTPSA